MRSHGINWKELELNPPVELNPSVCVLAKRVYDLLALVPLGKAEIGPGPNCCLLALADVNLHTLKVSERGLLAVQFVEYLAEVLAPRITMRVYCAADRIPSRRVGSSSSFLAGFRNSRDSILRGRHLAAIRHIYRHRTVAFSRRRFCGRAIVILTNGSIVSASRDPPSPRGTIGAEVCAPDD